jgi:hypothetical protein
MKHVVFEALARLSREQPSRGSRVLYIHYFGQDSELGGMPCLLQMFVLNQSAIKVNKYPLSSGSSTPYLDLTPGYGYHIFIHCIT